MLYSRYLDILDIYISVIITFRYLDILDNNQAVVH